MSHSSREVAGRIRAPATGVMSAMAALVVCLVAAGAWSAPAETPAPAADPAAAKALPTTEPPLAPPAEKPASATEPKPSESPAKTPGEKPAAAEKAAPPAKQLTEEEIRELPILKRYELPTEKFEAYLGDVKDHTFGYDEPAFYAILAFLTKQRPELLKPTHDDEDTPYSQLLAMPSSYRGKPVTLRGAYMICTPWRVPVAALAKDVPHLYTVTLRELPLDKAMPVATVIVSEDPMAYLRVEDEVRVKGYFYKIRDYEGTKGPGQAPMILAQRLYSVLDLGQPEGPSLIGNLGRALGNNLLAGMIIACVILVVVFFYLRLRIRQGPRAKGKYPFHVHKFRLRRDGGQGPPDPSGSAGPPSSPKPQGGADH